MAKKILPIYATLCTEFYDLEHHVNHTEALSFYQEHAKQANGPILEPMCGSGRFLIPLLQAGLDAEGFDASAAMINSFRKKYANLTTKKAPVWQEWVQDFKSDKHYQLIFIPYGSWGLITDRAEAKQGLENIYRHLAPHGKFIVEIETIASVPQPCGIWRRGTHTRNDGALIALSFITSYQPQTQLFFSHSYYELIMDNKIKSREEELFKQYLYRIDEFDQLLEEVGFSKIKKYTAFDPTQTPREDTPTIIYECSR